MKIKLLVLSLFIITTIGANAQGFFGSVPKPAGLDAIKAKLNKKNLTALDISATTTILEKNEFRPSVAMASYIIGKDVKEGSIITGAGVSWQHLKFNLETEKWNIVYSINGLLYGRIPLGPESNGKKLLTGISVGAFDNLILVGYATDFSNSYGTIGVGIPLNNL